jgi:nucleotide-binding universal stress UspA family protein
MKRILVAVDGSASAQRAVDYAIGQAKQYPLRMELVYVTVIPDSYATLHAYLARKENRQFAERKAKQVLAPAARKCARAKLPHRVSALWGDIAPEIVRAARRLKCDSIVMGTRGMGPVGNLLLGSVATKVIHLSKIAVTLVR